MNATPQLGPTASGSTVAAGNPSLGDFLLASSTTDSTVAPDFRTIAASFFANTAVTAPTGQTTTQSASGSTKSGAPSKSRERESSKDNQPINSGLPLSFVATIPNHLLNIPESVYQVVSRPIISGFAKQDDAPIAQTEATSTSLVTNLPQTSSQVVAAALQQPGQNSLPQQAWTNSPTGINSDIFRGFQARPITSEYFPQKPSPAPQPQDNSLLRDFRASGPMPGISQEAEAAALHSSDDNQQAQSAKPFPPAANAIAQPLSVSIQDGFTDTPALTIAKPVSNVVPPTTAYNDQPVLQTPDISASEIKTASTIVASTPNHTSVNDLAQKTTSNSTQPEIALHQTPSLATHVDQAPVLSVNPQLNAGTKTTQNAQDKGDKQNLKPANSARTEVSNNNQTSQSLAPKPPSATIAQTLFLEPASVSSEIAAPAIVPSPETNTAPVPPVQSNLAPFLTAAQSEVPVQSTVPATVIAVSTAPNTRPNTPTFTPVNTAATKPGTGKIRSEATGKTKINRDNADNDAGASSPAAELRQHELHPVSAPQAATNGGANKNQDALAPVANLTPHSKSAPEKSAPGVSSDVSANAAQAPDMDDAAPASAHTSINTAKLVQGISQSELRVGLQTRDFGNIDIRTSVSRHEFTAQISVEHSDVARTLTNELPGLYARLSEQQVSVSNIHIQNQGLATSSSLEQQSRQSSSHQQSNGTSKSQLEPPLPAVPEVLSPTDRLDIRI